MEKFVKTRDGLTLWSESFGDPDDPPLLLIMGAMTQGIFWPEPFCRQLAAAGFQVIRYDHRDTGKSSQVDFAAAPYDLDRMTDDARAVLEAHNQQPAVVVGLSMGGYIAQLLAIRDPAKVSALVLIGTSADHRPYMAATLGQPVGTFHLPGPAPEFLASVHAKAANPPTTPEAILEDMLNRWAITYGGARPYPREAVRAAMEESFRRLPGVSTAYQHAFAVARSGDRLEAVRRIRAPTLVIHAEFDVCLPLPHGRDLAERIPGARLQIFPMGHTFMWSWDDEVREAILQFLGTAGGPGKANESEPG